MKQASVRVRFAPSPTGHLHIGSLRTALFNWLFARHYKGVFLLRIEDTDLERSKQEYTESILDAFAWVGIVSDEPIVIQSERIAEHTKIIETLLASGKAYRCYCTPEQVVARYEKNNPGDAFVKYDGLCRSLKNHPQDVPSVVRFALPVDRQEVVFEDLICGRVSFHINQLDDFIIARSDGRPMYNFVVVADDAFMDITHIIRAQEHLINTPKQILLYEACGYSVPQFAHVSLILGPGGDKLSKRDAATSVLDYKKEGYLPEALLNYLARLGWAHGDQEIFSSAELVSYFSLDHVGKKGAIFDAAKLQWVNAVYMRKMAAADLYTYALSCLDTRAQEKLKKYHATNRQQLYAIIDLYKERAHMVKELMDMVLLVCEGPLEYNAQDLVAWIAPETEQYLKELIVSYTDCVQFDLEQVKHVVKHLAHRHGLKLVQLAQPIRIALQGSSSGPGVFELLLILGKQESVRRMQILYDNLQNKAL
ncbi:MAG: glutamate--tRNA ligase [Candidatus Dependentiae bacterium]|nr:glutamate--tRNA ligase [Candidatus Dependentiae bacterium]